eukprot:SAG31_NODE_11441_length_1030_cov_0.772288_1_plen_140_part_10
MIDTNSYICISTQCVSFVRFVGQDVLNKLTTRLFDKYQDDDVEKAPTPEHLDNLNRIGDQVTRLHNNWIKMKQSGCESHFDGAGALGYFAHPTLHSNHVAKRKVQVSDLVVLFCIDRRGFSLRRTKDEKEHRHAVLSIIE